MICSKFSFFKRKKNTLRAKCSKTHETHPEFMECSVPFRFRKVKQTAKTRNPPYSAETARAASSEHSDRKYGWAELGICVRMYAMHACVYIDMYVCEMHIYISFFCTYKQFETRIHAYLLFHVRNGNGWMHVKWWVWCKHTHTQTATRAACTSRKNQAIQLQNLCASVWIRAHIWDKNGKFAASVRSCYASNTK